jgi:Ca2+-binding RTX toxin-like protein
MKSISRVGLVAAVVVAGQFTAMPAHAGEVVRCHGKRATIVGTDGPDVLEGTRRADVIAGLRGPDRIAGHGSEDIICGGGGQDVLRGNPGDDVLDGQENSDRFFGGLGDDRMIGANGYLDTVLFLDVRSRLRVDLKAGTASGEGNDVIERINSVVGTEGSDIIRGNGSHDFLHGGRGRDLLDGRGSGDDLEGGPGDDELIGGADGNGWGPNEAIYSSADAAVEVDLADRRATGGDGTDTLKNIDGATGSEYGDTLLGDEDANELTDARGGGADDDLLEGRAGPDVLYVAEGSDHVVGGLGNDFSTDFGLGNDPDARDVWEGGPGNDDFQADLHDEDPDRDVMLGAGGQDELRAGAGDSRLNGGGGADVLLGLFNVVAEDLFTGGAGDDYMSAAAGDDTLIGNDGTDEADGGDGIDACEAEDETDCESDPLLP